VEKTPASTPSFANSLMEAVFDEVKSDVKNLGGTARYALFKHMVTPFSGGSDHYIYSDPTVNVPCPMMIQWPDKFYHTNFDTIDKVDPEMLRKVSIMAATYTYYIANANIDEAIWLVEEVATRHKVNLIKKVQRETTLALKVARKEKRSEKRVSILSNLNEKIEYEVNLGSKAIRSVSRLVSNNFSINGLLERVVGEFKATADMEKRRAERAITNYLAVLGKELPKNHEKRLTKIEKKATAIVPKRLFRGPISITQWARRLSMKEKDALWKLNQEHKESRVLGTLALYWTNGNRDLLEI
jgi:hypothetical protein